jgi:hypothetical protein
MVMELKVPPSAVDVCAIESVFVHVTVVPTATFSGFGTKALAPKVRAPMGIDTAADDPDGVGDGLGVGVGAE